MEKAKVFAEQEKRRLEPEITEMAQEGTHKEEDKRKEEQHRKEEEERNEVQTKERAEEKRTEEEQLKEVEALDKRKKPSLAACSASLTG